MTQITRLLPVKLTLNERIWWTQRATDAKDAVVSLETRKAESAKSFNEQIKTETERLYDALDTLKRDTVDKMVECYESMDYALGSVTLVRLDTGEMVSERPMTAKERQGVLHLVEDKPLSLSERNQQIIEQEWKRWEASQAGKVTDISEAKKTGAN